MFNLLDQYSQNLNTLFSENNKKVKNSKKKAYKYGDQITEAQCHHCMRGLVSYTLKLTNAAIVLTWHVLNNTRISVIRPLVVTQCQYSTGLSYITVPQDIYSTPRHWVDFGMCIT